MNQSSQPSNFNSTQNPESQSQQQQPYPNQQSGNQIPNSQNIGQQYAPTPGQQGYQQPPQGHQQQYQPPQVQQQQYQPSPQYSQQLYQPYQTPFQQFTPYQQPNYPPNQQFPVGPNQFPVGPNQFPVGPNQFPVGPNQFPVGPNPHQSQGPNPLQGQVTQLQTQLSEKEQEFQKIKQDFDKLKKNTVPKEDCEIVEEQLKKLKKDCANILDLEETIDRLNRKIKSLNVQSEEDEETIKKLKAKILELERELDQLKKQSKANIEQLEDQIDAQKLRILSLQQSNSSTSNNNQSIYEEEIDKLRIQVRNQNTQIGELTELNQQLQASDKGKQMLELQFEITKLRNDLEVEHSNHMDKLDVITDLKKKIAVKDRDIKMKDDSISSLEHLKKEKNDKIALLDREIKNLNEIVQTLQQNISDLNSSMAKLKDRLLNQKGNVDLKENQALVDEMNNLQNKQEQQRLKLIEEEKKRQKELADQAAQKLRMMKEQKEKQEEERNQRSKRADNIKRKMLESHGQLEVCFLVDCTGSMDPYKQQTMQSISGSMQNIKKETGRDVKWSTVCYQDYDEKKKLPGNLYQQLNFTNQPVQLEEYLNKVKCAGGGDAAEDVRGGIVQMCQKISWNKPFRLAILICDAPSHGKTTNGGCGDNYPNDDMKDSIEMLIKQDIMFIGLNFTKHTKTMYSYIEKIFKEHKREDLFMFVNMDGVKQEDIWKEMVKKISEASVSVTATNKKETKSKGQKPNEVEKTKDGAIEALCKAGNFYNFEKQANVQCLDTKFKIYRVDIKEESFNKKIEDIHLIKVPEDYEVHQEGIWESIRTVKPFAFGMMKEVYLMKKKNATDELYVIKTPLGGKTYGTLNAAITECRSHLVCQKLMKKFTKEVNDACDEAETKGQKLPRYPQIVYSDFLILEEAPDSFWIAERFFKGEFIKYNNNNGYISSEQDQLNQMAQAFTYYTYHISNFNYMVNDIQGVEKYFTDPAINTGKGDFDETDMGEDGQAMFMVNFSVKKQVCRDILKLLNIYPED